MISVMPLKLLTLLEMLHLDSAFVIANEVFQEMQQYKTSKISRII